MLQEYKRRSKSNLFVDHRFGEHGGGETTPQERQIKRFVERKVRVRVRVRGSIVSPSVCMMATL